MSQDIPYGPDRKPWKETLSPLAINADGTPMVTPPSQDPAEVYSYPDLERGITPSNYQVPTIGFTADHARKAQDETSAYVNKQSLNHLGYQCSIGNDHSQVTRYLHTLLNNIGDPYVPGHFTINSKWMERNVLDYYASLWNAKWPHNDEDPETYWGYVCTMGSSEGNLYAVWNGRDYLQGKFMMTDVTRKVPTTTYVQAKLTADKPNAFTPVAFYSEDSHYSFTKCMAVLDVKSFYRLGTELYPGQCPLGGDWPTEVPSEGGDAGPGSIDVDKLYKLVEFFVSKGYPALILLNFGTTFKGAYDDVKRAGEMLLPMLRKHEMDERWIQVVDPNKPDDPKWIKRNGFWIHVDGALGSTYVPFMKMAFNKGRTAIKPPPDFDFRLPFVHSICGSGHKWPGAPWPLGIFMTKTGLQLLPPTNPDYVGSPDTTFAGSRNGLSSLVWWSFLTQYSYEAQIDRVVYSLELVKHTYQELQKVQTDIGQDIWINYTPLSLSLWFKKPNDDIVHKYTLSPESLFVDGEQRNFVHMFVMSNVAKETIDSLMQALREPNAFTTAEKRDKKWVRRARKAGVESRITDLHDGMILGKADQGLKNGVQPLFNWPMAGRGFK
ncbi:histidine decarboxylase-like [Dysidea avara]|uniref:histidine decarboxylase-like n=1 Tax=Dysidea avara TaxID=196820 RepID=UPI00331FB546